MANSDHAIDNIVEMKSFSIGKMDPVTGLRISKIYIKNKFYVLYDVKTEREEDSLQFFQFPEFDEHENESLFPVFFHLKSELSRVKGYPNFKYLKYEAIELFSDEKNISNKIIIELFSKKIKYEIKYQTRNKQIYILTGFLFSVFMLLSCNIINIELFPKLFTVTESPDTIYLFYAATMGTVGGYFSILMKINDFFLIGEDDRCGAVLLSLSRLLISAIAGIVSYLLIRAGMFSLSIDNSIIDTVDNTFINLNGSPIDSKSLYLINVFAFIAGFSEKLIPQFMQNFENRNAGQTKSGK